VCLLIVCLSTTGSLSGAAIASLMCTLSFCFYVCTFLTLRFYARVSGRILGGLSDYAGAFNPANSTTLNVVVRGLHVLNLGFLGIIVPINIPSAAAALDWRALYFALGAVLLCITALVVALIQEVIVRTMRQFTQSSAAEPTKVAFVAKQMARVRFQQLFWLMIMIPFITVGALFAARVLAQDYISVEFVCGIETFGVFFGAVSVAPPNARNDRKSRYRRQQQRRRERGGGARPSVWASGAEGESVLVHRGGAAVRVGLRALEEEMKEATVVFDDGVDVSVITQHVLDVDESDVLLARALGAQTVAWVKRVMVLVVPTGSEAHASSLWRMWALPALFWLLAGGSGMALIGVVLCEVGPVWLALFFPAFGVIELGSFPRALGARARALI